MGGLKRLAVSGAIGGHLHDPAGADPGLPNVIWILLGPQCPGDGAAAADLVIRCHNRDLALAMELAADLVKECLLVGPDRQQDVGLLLLEELKKGCWLWRAGAWMRMSSRSS